MGFHWSLIFFYSLLLINLFNVNFLLMNAIPYGSHSVSTNNTFPFHRTRRRFKICSWRRENPFMGQNLVQGKVTASESQMDIEQMVMDPWLPHLVGTQWVEELPSYLHHDLTRGAKMATLRKWEGCLQHLWTLSPCQRTIQYQHTHQYAVLS